MCLNWTKVGLKGFLRADGRCRSARLNWTKVGLKAVAAALYHFGDSV